MSSLLVDTLDMRTRYGEDFALAVPEDAIEGTTENMLGADVLDLGIARDDEASLTALE